MAFVGIGAMIHYSMLAPVRWARVGSTLKKLLSSSKHLKHALSTLPTRWEGFGNQEKIAGYSNYLQYDCVHALIPRVLLLSLRSAQRLGQIWWRYLAYIEACTYICLSLLCTCPSLFTSVRTCSDRLPIHILQNLSSLEVYPSTQYERVTPPPDLRPSFPASDVQTAWSPAEVHKRVCER